MSDNLKSLVIALVILALAVSLVGTIGPQYVQGRAMAMTVKAAGIRYFAKETWRLNGGGSVSSKNDADNHYFGPKIESGDFVHAIQVEFHWRLTDMTIGAITLAW